MQLTTFASRRRLPCRRARTILDSQRRGCPRRPRAKPTPGRCWPLALASSLLILSILWRALRAPAAWPGRAASGTALLALDLAVFLLCYALRETDADWHATAFYVLLAAPHAGITRHLLGGAGLAVLAPAALREQMKNSIASMASRYAS